MKSVLPYTTKAKLDDFISKVQHERSLLNEEVSFKDIEQELADYCGLSLNGIRQIRREFCSPSIQAGAKIAEYFGAHVEDIFPLVDKEELMQN